MPSFSQIGRAVESLPSEKRVKQGSRLEANLKNAYFIKGKMQRKVVSTIQIELELHNKRWTHVLVIGRQTYTGSTAVGESSQDKNLKSFDLKSSL